MQRGPAERAGRRHAREEQMLELEPPAEPRRSAAHRRAGDGKHVEQLDLAAPCADPVREVPRGDVVARADARREDEHPRRAAHFWTMTVVLSVFLTPWLVTITRNFSG